MMISREEILIFCFFSEMYWHSKKLFTMSVFKNGKTFSIWPHTPDWKHNESIDSRKKKKLEANKLSKKNNKKNTKNQLDL